MNQKSYHFNPLTEAEAEAMLPLMESAGGLNATDPMMRMRYADCLLALGRADAARAAYQSLISADPWFLPAHTALLYLQVKDEPVQDDPKLIAATNLPLGIRSIYEFPMLVPYGFPDVRIEMQKQPYFNRLMGLLAKLLYPRIPNLTALDIGANIGQSVAEINFNAPIPCLSIESVARTFALARYNIRRLNPANQALHSLVGISGLYGKQVYDSSLGKENLAPVLHERTEATDENAVPAKSLSELLDMAPKFSGSRMVKIDAEGWDWDIIADNAWFWQRNQPWLFFENNPEFAPTWAEGNARSANAIQTLLNCGYQQFLVFDDNGRYLGQVEHNHLQRMHEFNAFQAMNRSTGGSVGHYDILAVPSAEAAWIPELLASMFPDNLYGASATFKG